MGHRASVQFTPDLAVCQGHGEQPAAVDAIVSHRHLGDHGLPPDTPIAVGTRACDSAQRYATFKKHGPRRGDKFFPVWDWNKAKLVAELKAAGAKLPAEYRVFGRSWDGLDFRFLHGVRKHWPEDYRRILEWFPLAELEIKRHEFAMKHKEQAHGQEEKVG